MAAARSAEATIEILAELAQDEDEGVREAVGAHAGASEETLAILGKDSNINVRRRVAANSNAPPAALLDLAKDPDDYIRECIAANPATPAIALAELAKDRDPNVWRKVAANPSAPADALAECAKNSDRDVRQMVAANRGTPAKVLHALAGDLLPTVRRAVAANRTTPAATLEDLAKDYDAEVRLWTASHPSTPLETLATLITDRNQNVRFEAIRNASVRANAPQTTQHANGASEKGKSWGPSQAILEVIRRDSAPPPGILQVMIDNAQSPDARVRQRAAVSHFTPPSALRLLAQDAEAGIREAVAMNPATPSEVLALLGRDPIVTVRLYAAWNDATPIETLAALRRDTDSGIGSHDRTIAAWNARKHEIGEEGDSSDSIETSSDSVIILPSPILDPPAHAPGILGTLSMTIRELSKDSALELLANEYNVSVSDARKALEDLRSRATHSATQRTGTKLRTAPATPEPHPDASPQAKPPVARRSTVARELFDNVPPALQAKEYEKGGFPSELLDDTEAVRAARRIVSARNRRKGIELTDEEAALVRKANRFIRAAERHQKRTQAHQPG